MEFSIWANKSASGVNSGAGQWPDSSRENKYTASGVEKVYAPNPVSTSSTMSQLAQYYSRLYGEDENSLAMFSPVLAQERKQSVSSLGDTSSGSIQPEETREVAMRTNFGNDYSDHFLRTGILPQAHIMNVSNPLVGYPRLQRLHELKAQRVAENACKPFCASVDVALMPRVLTDWANSGAIFDVVLVGGCFKTQLRPEYLISLPISLLTPKPSVAFVWVPSHGLEIGRQALGAWGFRRSEDITFLAMSKDSPFYPPQVDHDFIEKSTWHCLMGIKGTLRRSEHAELINCNVDTDTIVESKEHRLNVIPEPIYKVIENFSLMSRRLHVVPGTGGEMLPVRPRPGWVIASPDCILNNFSVDSYMEEIKVVGARVPMDLEIDALRPKTPPRSKRN